MALHAGVLFGGAAGVELLERYKVLEGGPLRMRRAVDLAGLALDATDAADAELRRRLSARNG
jgi:hypothetical protein